MSYDLEVLVDDAIFTESPRWHDDSLWFSDIGAGQVRRLWLNGRKAIVVEGMAMPSGLGWTPNGDLLVASIGDSTVYRVGVEGVPRYYCGTAEHGAFNTNDMATRDARSYVTCNARPHRQGDSMETLSQPTGVIIMIDHETGACRRVSDGLRMPNGVGISSNGQHLFVNELAAHRVLLFDIYSDGALSEPRIFSEIGAMVDGLCLDAEGGLWLGAHTAFLRVDAEGGVTDKIEVPGWSCVAPMLGGPTGRCLFMTVMQSDGADAVFRKTARSRVLRTDTEIPASQ